MNNYRISAEGIKLIKHFEGFRDSGYFCAGGKWTIGYGHVIDKMKEQYNSPITETDATRILYEDLKSRENSVKKLVTVSLSQGQFDALVSFVFNLGEGVLKKSTLLKSLNNGRYGEAKDELAKFTLAGGKKLEGLVKRRKAEQDLWDGIMAI